MTSKEDWDRIERRSSNPRRAPKNYAKHTCIRCGRTISEGAYSGKNGNYKKHMKACEPDE
jgi:hypothetical protein